MGNYADVSDIRDFKVNGQEVSAISGYSDDEINSVISYAEEVIENICNDWFYAKSVTEYFDGNNGDTLFFPPTILARCLSITSVEEVDSEGNVLDTLTEDTDFKVYDYYLEICRGSQATPTIDRWKSGTKNYKVAGSFGRTTTPETIKRAAKILSVYELVPEVLSGLPGYAGSNFRSAEWDDFKISLDTKLEELSTRGVSTGVQKVDRMLKPYINYSDLFLNLPKHE